MMRRNLLTIMAIVLSLSVFLVGCGGNNSGGSNGSGEERETFRVGLEAGYAPFNWTQMTDENGGVPIDGNREFAGGYDVEIAKIIAEGLDRDLVIVKTEWDGLLPALTSGTIDAIIAGMSPTAERAEVIDFTDNYYESDLVMVVRSGGDFENASSLSDFSGSRVTAQLNTFHYTVIDQIEGVIRETAMDNFAAMRVALEAGMIDAYVSERPEAVSASAANPNFTMVELEDGFVTAADDTAIAVGLVKDSDLREAINQILAGISQEQRQEIMDNAILTQPSAE